MKCYVVVENFTQDVERMEEVVDTRVMSVHSTKELAIEAIAKYHDETFDDIIGGDENELSRVSFDEDWNGESRTIQSDSCCEWEWKIEEHEID